MSSLSSPLAHPHPGGDLSLGKTPTDPKLPGGSWGRTSAKSVLVPSGPLLHVPDFVPSPPPPPWPFSWWGYGAGAAMDRAGTEQVGAGWVSGAGTQVLCV